MLSEERRQLILERLKRDGKVVAAELSEALNVSPDTVRRDLRELADLKLLRRVHGGALPPVVGTRPYVERLEQAPETKVAIGRAASRLFRSGQVILLDAGTTTLEVARHLPTDLEAMVVTNSPPIAVALADHPSVDVTVVGGMLAKGTQALVGAAAVDALRSVRADILVLGVCSLHPDIGITVLDAEESYVKRAMIANAAEVVAVSAADKLGSAGSYVVAPLEELTYVVTEEHALPEQLEGFRAAGIEIVFI